MEFIIWVVIIVMIYVIIYSIYRYLKENSLAKRLVNYNRERVLYQDSASNSSGEFKSSYFTVLTNKKLYLFFFFSIFPVYWNIENKLIKSISYKTIKTPIFNTLSYWIRINNRKRHFIHSKDEFDIFIKRLKKINPSIKITKK